jgi:hypothetical protein
MALSLRIEVAIMKGKPALLSAVLMLLGASAGAQAPGNATVLTPVDLARIWLLEDCGLSTYSFARVFVDSRVEIVPVLVRAFDEGPPEELRAATRQSAALAFERRQDWLRNNRPQWLDDETARAMQSAQSDDAIQRALVALDAKYRQQALNGLAIAGGDEARKALERVAKSDSAYKNMAEMALRAAQSANQR